MPIGQKKVEHTFSIYKLGQWTLFRGFDAWVDNKIEPLQNEIPPPRTSPAAIEIDVPRASNVVVHCARYGIEFDWCTQRWSCRMRSAGEVWMDKLSKPIIDQKIDSVPRALYGAVAPRKFRARSSTTTVHIASVVTAARSEFPPPRPERVPEVGGLQRAQCADIRQVAVGSSMTQ